MFDDIALAGSTIAEDEGQPSKAAQGVQSGLKAAGDTGSDNVSVGDAKTKVGGIAQTAIDILFWAIGIIAVIMIIVGGIMYATSMGDPGKAKKAKDAIMYGIVGLVIALLAFAIVRFVTGVLA